MTRPDGSFESIYWKENYAKPQTMDGIGNAKEHARYMKAIFDLDLIDISSVVDLGFGLGYLFKEVLKTFKPYKALGIEPSTYAYKKVTSRSWNQDYIGKLKFVQTDLKSWCQKKSTSETRFDLGICTSVFQYIPTKDLNIILPILSARIKYLYLTFPTDKELDFQKERLNFHDRFALRRSQKTYKRLISPYFTFISSRVLESKSYFDEDKTLFTDLMFRF